MATAAAKLEAMAGAARVEAIAGLARVEEAMAGRWWRRSDGGGDGPMVGPSVVCRGVGAVKPAVAFCSRAPS